MPKPSIYASKCKVCGVEIAKGEDIRNYGTHWCKDEVCARSKQAQPAPAPAPAPPQAPPQAQPAQAPPVQPQPAMQPTLMTQPPVTASMPKKEQMSIMELQAKLDLFEIAHDKTWSLSKKKALEALPNDKDKASRHILAQVIYKKAIDFLNHQ